MHASDVRRLNAEFALAFGRVDGDRPKFKWCRPSELYYFIHNGTRETRSPAGVILVEPRHARHTYAGIYGETWMIAKWRPPMSKSAWEQQFGSQFQYESGGQYYPIDGTQLPMGMNPDAEITQMAIRKIAAELEKPPEVHLSETKAMAERAEMDAWNRNSDIFDDSMPAFNNEPGTKGHVSFPAVASA